LALPLHERAHSGTADALVRLTTEFDASPELFRFEDLGKPFAPAQVVTSLIPSRPLDAGENYRFHFDMTKCIGCRSCEIACNEQNGNPADIRWRRIGEIEGGEYPDTLRHYLSMGCNHCLDADCVRGCPVEAYTKDPVTGIVLHSADACIGCQYCVWNCPYSVPQFNAARGVVGKCDMCHGRLTDGLEPACVNACPEAAIEIEIVNIADWKKNFVAAESPGMPAADITISTTRITLPKSGPIELEKVDDARVHPEHAHLSLVFMTTLIQAVAGAITYSIVLKQVSPLPLLMLLAITAFTLQISVFHLGRPAYAYRAVKMWRRSWLSREVAFFGLFFGALAALTAAVWLAPLQLALPALHLPALPRFVFATLEAATILFGGAGIVASACIYLIPARPAWNMVHTPVDFLLSAALMGIPLPFVLEQATTLLHRLPLVHRFVAGLPALEATYAGVLGAGIAAAWLVNMGIKVVRLKRSAIFEEQASYTLLRTRAMHPALIASFVCVAISGALLASHAFTAGLLFASIGVLLSRYLFFVSVVPLNMALTYVRRQAA
jgi:DMSO reductase iron-sulfur subunit